MWLWTDILWCMWSYIWDKFLYITASSCDLLNGPESRYFMQCNATYHVDPFLFSFGFCNREKPIPHLSSQSVRYTLVDSALGLQVRSQNKLDMCLWFKVKIWQKSVSPTFWPCPPHPKGHVMLVKCEEPIDELIVQVWLLYYHQNFKYCTSILIIYVKATNNP